MSEGPFKPVDLRALLQASKYIHPYKEELTEFLDSFIDEAFDARKVGDHERALSIIRDFNSKLKEGPHIGRMLELYFEIPFKGEEAVLLELIEMDEQQMESSDIRAFYHFLVGGIQFEMLDFDDCRKRMKRCIDIDAKFWEAYYVRAYCLAIRGKHYSAIEDYYKALKGDLDKNQVKACLAYSYIKSNQHRKALKLHKEVVDHFPDNAMVQYNTAVCYKRFRAYKKSMKHFDRAVQLSPENLDFRLTRGRVLMRLRRYHEASHDLELAIQNAVVKRKCLAEKLLEICVQVLNGERRHWSAKRAARRVMLEAYRSV